MARAFAKSFYNSSAWIKCRASYIDSVNGLCEKCLANGTIAPGEILHHKIELTPENINDPDITLGWDNLQYVCQDCHNKIHFGDPEILREGLCFDDNGDLIQANPPHSGPNEGQDADRM